MTYKEVILAIRGYENWQIREWERARLIAYQVYTSIPKQKGHGNKPIHQYLPLPSDLRNRNIKTKEEIEAQRRFFVEKQRKENEIKLNK